MVATAGKMTQADVEQLALLAALRVKYRAEASERQQEEAREQEHDRYHPRGAVRELFYATDPQIMISGPAGTGKSRGALEKLHRAALDYPGMRGLIARKTRTSLTQSAMVTFKRDVLGPLSDISFHVTDQEYRYPNGSVIVVAGLDKPGKALSSEYDLIYVMQAEELTQEDWETLSTRKGRVGPVPHPQLFGDCNPGPPTHWIKRKADAGAFRMLESRHEDNPTLWDIEQGRWTKRGEGYIAELDKLEGARKERLRFGRWVAAEGLVYEGWDAALNVLDPFEVPAAWPRYRVIDFGYTNPFVCQWWAEDPDGRLIMYREIYETGRLVEDLAGEINELSAGEHIVATIADHDAEDRATLDARGIGTIAADKDVSPGIQAVKARIRKADDGKPRLFIMRDSTVRRDQSLVDKGKPASTLEEIDGYVWEKGSGAKSDKETPHKQNDHGMDGTRYMVFYLDAGVSEGVFF